MIQLVHQEANIEHFLWIVVKFMSPREDYNDNMQLLQGMMET